MRTVRRPGRVAQVTDERLAIVRKFGLACFVAGLAILICVTTAWASSYSLWLTDTVMVNAAPPAGIGPAGV
jgi:hypothetical protein